MPKFLIVGDSTKIKPIREWTDDDGLPIMEFDDKYEAKIWNYYDPKKYYLKHKSATFYLVYVGHRKKMLSEWDYDYYAQKDFGYESRFKRPTFKSKLHVKKQTLQRVWEGRGALGGFGNIRCIKYEWK